MTLDNISKSIPLPVEMFPAEFQNHFKITSSGKQSIHLDDFDDFEMKSSAERILIPSKTPKAVYIQPGGTANKIIPQGTMGDKTFEDSIISKVREGILSNTETFIKKIKKELKNFNNDKTRIVEIINTGSHLSVIYVELKQETLVQYKSRMKLVDSYKVLLKYKPLFLELQENMNTVIGKYQ